MTLHCQEIGCSEETRIWGRNKWIGGSEELRAMFISKVKMSLLLSLHEVGSIYMDAEGQLHGEIASFVDLVFWLL